MKWVPRVEHVNTDLEAVGSAQRAFLIGSRSLGLNADGKSVTPGVVHERIPQEMKLTLNPHPLKSKGATADSTATAYVPLALRSFDDLVGSPQDDLIATIRLRIDPCTPL